MSAKTASDTQLPLGWLRLAAIVAIFAGIGPLVGLVVFGAALSVRGLLAGKGWESLYLIPFFMIYGLLFAHFVGGLYAAAAGIATAAVARWHGRVTSWMALVIGVACWLACGFASRGTVLTSPMPADDIAAEMLVVSVVSTFTCWRLAVAWTGLRR